MSATTDEQVYVVTGTNGGIGLALVTELAARPGKVTIYAAVRDATKPSAALKALSEDKAQNGTVKIVTLPSANEEAGRKVAKIVEENHPKGSLKVVIANAATGTGATSIRESKLADYTSDYNTNVLGVVALFQAFRPLLTSGTKFIPITSLAGSLAFAASVPFNIAAYAPSKAALNMVSVLIHAEEKDLVCFPIHPGVVDTPAGGPILEKAKALDIKTYEYLMSIRLTSKQSAEGILTVIDASTRETHGGKFLTYTGEEAQW